MYKSILSTTTDLVEGTCIEKYIDLISVNVVIGTNFFSDLGASFTDLFGGFSGSYQKKLEGIYKSGMDKLKAKAMYLGANAIVGVKIDFDEISGKGKSMFMLSVTGTAVRLKYEAISFNNNVKNEIETVSSEVLEKEIMKRLIKNRIANDELPTKNEWRFLLDYPIEEITEQLLDLFLKFESPSPSDIHDTNQNLVITNFPNYITFLNRSHLDELLYSRLIENQNPIMKLLISIDLFSPNKIIELIKTGNPKLAIKCLQIQKENYSDEDLKLMKEMVTLFDNLKDLGKIEVVKGVLGKSKEKYICPNGHKNDLNVKFCQHVGNYTCGLNIKGLTQKEVHAINLFKIKVDSLDSIFNQN